MSNSLAEIIYEGNYKDIAIMHYNIPKFVTNITRSNFNNFIEKDSQSMEIFKRNFIEFIDFKIDQSKNLRGLTYNEKKDISTNILFPLIIMKYNILNLGKRGNFGKPDFKLTMTDFIKLVYETDFTVNEKKIINMALTDHNISNLNIGFILKDHRYNSIDKRTMSNKLIKLYRKNSLYFKGIVKILDTTKYIEYFKEELKRKNPKEYSVREMNKIIGG